MDKKIIYTKFSKLRKKEFSIRTTISKDSQGELKVEKSGDKYSSSTIQRLIDTYKELYKISKKFTVVPIKQTDEYTVEFPFIDGPTLHEQATSAETKEEYNSVISSFIRLLDSIPTETIQLNKEFEKIFGKIDKEKEYLCVKKGVLDFNLGNLIVDSKGKVHFFDYEWCYPFPIPRDFVLFRALLVLHLNTSSKSFYTLDELLEKYLIDNDSIKQYRNWEEYFYKNIVLERENHAIYTISMIDVDIFELKNENKLLQEEIGKTREESKKLEVEKTMLYQEAEEFRASKKGKIWGYLKKYRHLKNIIKDS